MLELHLFSRSFQNRLSITQSKSQFLNLVFCLLFSVFCLLYLPCTAVAGTATVMVEWDPSPDSVTGYEFCYGTSSGSYEHAVDVGSATSCSISGLEEGTTYYFAARAYDAAGVKSEFSEELVHTMPTSKPDTPVPDPDIPALEPETPATEPETPALEPETPATEVPTTPTDGGGGTEVTTFNPVADTTVRINRPTRNYGSRSYLEVDASGRKISYLRFNVSGLSGTVVSARIQLKCIDESSFGGTIYAISDNSWHELTMTWDNQPGIDSLSQDTLGAVSVGDIVELDVTSAVTGNGTYNFAMDSNNNNGADYYSREGLNPPVLIITTAAAEDTAGNESTASTETDIEETHILIEAEDGQINYPFEYVWDSSASAEGFIWVANGQGSSWDPSDESGYAEYNFEVPSAGNYIIWGRIKAKSRKDNSFFISVNDGDYALWDTQKSKSWVWDAVSNRKGADPVVYYLKAGEHTLKIKQREDGTKIDRILITGDLTYTPE